MHKRILFILAIASAALLLNSAGCKKNDNPTPPTPTGKQAVDEGGSGGQAFSDNHCTDIGQTPVILAYYTEWNTDRKPDLSLITHLNYAHGRFKNPKTGDGGIVFTGTSKFPETKIKDVKKEYPHIKIMMMVGGWGAHADGFSMMAKDEKKRDEFCHSVNEHMKTYGFDGIDIDWEYPTVSADNETGSDKDDTKNFNILLKQLRDTLGTSKIISFASSSSAKYVDWPTAIKYLDYVNVMTYDMGAAPKGHNSPLFKSSTFDSRSCEESVELHKKAGIPYERQVMGIPFYGKAEKNPESGTKIFDYSVGYKEMDDILNKGLYKGKPLARPVQRRWDSAACVPYLVDESGKNVLSYDDPESVTAKANFAKSKGLLGVMFWEFRYDDNNFSLQKALDKAYYGKETVIK